MRQEKPSKANTGVLEPVYLISYGVNLFASTKTPDDVVYKVVKGLHDHAKEMGNIFPPLRLLDTNAMAQPIAGVEYHDGADQVLQRDRPMAAEDAVRSTAHP